MTTDKYQEVSTDELINQVKGVFSGEEYNVGIPFYARTGGSGTQHVAVISIYNRETDVKCDLYIENSYRGESALRISVKHSPLFAYRIVHVKGKTIEAKLAEVRDSLDRLKVYVESEEYRNWINSLKERTISGTDAKYILSAYPTKGKYQNRDMKYTLMGIDNDSMYSPEELYNKICYIVCRKSRSEFNILMKNIKIQVHIQNIMKVLRPDQDAA